MLCTVHIQNEQQCLRKGIRPRLTLHAKESHYFPWTRIDVLNPCPKGHMQPTKLSSSLLGLPLVGNLAGASGSSNCCSSASVWDQTETVQGLTPACWVGKGSVEPDPGAPAWADTAAQSQHAGLSRGGTGPIGTHGAQSSSEPIPRHSSSPQSITELQHQTCKASAKTDVLKEISLHYSQGTDVERLSNFPMTQLGTKPKTL